MGFAASQARFLSLTSRMYDVEGEMSEIQAERVALAHTVDEISDKHSQSLHNEVLMANINKADEGWSKVVLSYDVLTRGYLEGGMGMQLVTDAGRIVVPSKEEMDKQIETASQNGEVLSPEDFYIYEDVVKTSVLQKNLEEGNFYMVQGKNNDGEWKKLSIESSLVTKEYDKTDDAAAEAYYNKELKRLETIDNEYQMRANTLETTHKQLENQLEVLDKMIKKDVEEGFKTFMS